MVLAVRRVLASVAAGAVGDSDGVDVHPWAATAAGGGDGVDVRPWAAAAAAGGGGGGDSGGVC